MDERIKTLIEQVAAGVWIENDLNWTRLSQCAFCRRAPEAGHEKDCPVVIAREIIADIAKN